MKSCLTALGIVFLVLLAAVAAFIGYAALVGGKLDASSKAYVDESVPAIVTNWDIAEMTKRASPEFLSATSADDLAKLFQTFKTLGPMLKYEGSTGASNVNFDQSGKHITATYHATATFQNGKADIQVALVQHNGAWQILGFRVDSSVFLK